MSTHISTIIMYKIIPVDDVAALEGTEKAEKRTMTCDGVPHTRKHTRTNGSMLCDCKHNMSMSAHTHKGSDNEQGDHTSLGVHDLSCFNKDEVQKLDTPYVAEPMEEVIHEMDLVDLIWTYVKVRKFEKNILMLKASVVQGLLNVKSRKEHLARESK